MKEHLPVNLTWIPVLQNGITHTIPMNDIGIHRNTIKCRCRPVMIKTEINTPLLVHHSFDGRELFEDTLEASFGFEIFSYTHH